MFKLGLLGYGKMGSCIIQSICDSKLIDKNNICVYSNHLEFPKKDGFICLNSELEVFENSDIVLFAIKPQTFEQVIEKLSVAKKAPRVIISIAAGITIDYLQKAFKKSKIVRVMPNLCAQIKLSVSTVSFATGLNPSEQSEILQIIDSFGTHQVVKEEFIDKLIPLNGSFPAYFWYFMRSFSRALEAQGVSSKMSIELLANTSIGCSKLLLSENKDLDELIQGVCSAKGTTIEGIQVFDDSRLDDIVKECAFKCINRAKELEKK